MEQCNNGTMELEQWNNVNGTLEQWNYGTMEK